MKLLKNLLLVFMVTLVTGSIGVFAYSSSYLTIQNQKVPGFNGKWISPGRHKDVLNYGDQKIVNINTTRELDVILEFYSDSSNGWKRGTTVWSKIANGKDTIFLSDGATGFYPSLMEADYRLYIDSRITYLNDTTINYAKWELGDNHR